MRLFKRAGRRGLSVLLALILLLPIALSSNLPISAASTDITVYIDFEGYNLGQGFYVAPVKLELPAGSTAADATAALFERENIESRGLDSGYLSDVKGFDKGTVSIPSYITEQPGFEQTSAINADEWLGAGDYAEMSGWMYTINHAFGANGINGDVLNNGDVIRWQFTVWGYGLDLGVDNGWSASGPYYEQVDKSYLIRLLFDAGAQEADQTAALSVIINALAAEEAVAFAEDALINTSSVDLIAGCSKLTAPTAATVSVVDGNKVTASAADYYIYKPITPFTARSN
ncbi:MAG: DUF4430 domain-containing protein, partial [Oscillospiraceae bacterium]|nr:DUF4430 domain-containing protein [Oscillospiraceae bacterium]